MRLKLIRTWSPLLIVLACFTLALTPSLSASAVDHSQKTSTQNARIETTGIASEPLACLTVSAAGETTATPATGSIELRWNGEVEQARLMLKVAGSEAAHTILVNGQAVATAPIFVDGAACDEGEVFYIDIPTGAVVQGENTITLTNDANAADSWHAAAVRLEVLGKFATGETRDGTGDEDGVQIASTQATLSTINFVNRYDGTTQQARVQVPSGYNSNTPTPLLLAIHPRSADMFYPESKGFHTAANSKGWFFASPQLHGAWPGTTAMPTPNPPGQYAYASLQSQYDIVGTVQYLVERYNIDPDRIYLFGVSMGSQVGEVTVAKFPSLFAAAFFNKGPSDWTKWHQQTQIMINQGYRQSFHRQWMERECYVTINGTPTARTPAQNPFCYQSRSAVNYARNLLHVPIALTHSQADVLVPHSHSVDLQAAINALGPDHQVNLHTDTVVGPPCNDQGMLDPGPYTTAMRMTPMMWSTIWASLCAIRAR